MKEEIEMNRLLLNYSITQLMLSFCHFPVFFILFVDNAIC